MGDHPPITPCRSAGVRFRMSLSTLQRWLTLHTRSALAMLTALVAAQQPCRPRSPCPPALVSPVLLSPIAFRRKFDSGARAVDGKECSV
eukprot:3662041-Rhodomonas_salina.4